MADQRPTTKIHTKSNPELVRGRFKLQHIGMNTVAWKFAPGWRRNKVLWSSKRLRLQ